MITIFSCPKAFKGDVGLIQKNAIKSWKQLGFDCEIILFGNDEGVAQISAEIGAKHIADVKCNEFGTPLISEIFEIAQNISKYDKLAFINLDFMVNSLIPLKFSSVLFAVNLGPFQSC